MSINIEEYLVVWIRFSKFSTMTPVLQCQRNFMLIRVFLKLRTGRLSLMVSKLKSVEFSLAFCGASCYANKNRNEKFSWKRGERLSKHAFAGGMFSPFSLKCDNRTCETEGFTFSEGHSAIVGTGNQALQGHAFHTILRCMHQ